MRFKLTVPCVLILSCMFSIARSTALAQPGDKGLPATVPAESSTVSSDVIAVVKEYTEAMLSGRNADAAALVDSSFQAGWPSKFESTREMVNARSIPIRVVLASEKNGLALAVSQPVRLSRSHPDLGTYAMFFVYLKRSDRKWLVTGHGLLDYRDAEMEIDRFQQASADAKTILYIKAVATEAKNVESGDDIVQIYSLQHADAVLLEGILNRLFRPETIKFVPDPATNSIIASGKRKDLEVIEAIVLRLDSPTANDLSANRDTDTSRSTATRTPEASTDSSDVIAVVKEYSEAMLSGRTAEAADLVDSSFKPGWTSQFESTREMTNARSIQFVTVQVSEKNGLALAVSDEVDISAAYPKSNRSATACFVVELKRNDQKWLVTRHAFVPSEVAKQLIARFQKTSADAKVIPSIKAVAAMSRNVENDWLNVKQVEERTAKIAHDVKAASGDTRIALQQRLRSEVRFSFETRQQLQRAELQKLREQLVRIEKSIESRERNKDKIIDHRVEELLNPELQ